VATAIAMGLRQTLGESIHGTYPLLFHRPAERRWLIGMKLLVGVAAYLATGVVSIVAYSLWAATPGTHASPFQWAMTVPAWILWFGIAILYLGAFLTGIRPGRWFGTRLLPLVAAGLATVATTSVFFLYCQEWLILILILLVEVGTIAVIFFVVRMRDYP